MAEQFDVVVIGGGPAGSVSALYARRAGFSVCVLEKAQFPRETLCGEFLSHEVVDVLDDLGLRSDFLALEPNPIRHVVLCSGSSAPLRAPLGFTAYGLTRGRFDAFLLSMVRREGINVHQPCEVTDVNGTVGSFEVVCTSANGPMSIRSRRIVAAHGKSPLTGVDRRVSDAIGRSRFVAAKFHVPLSLLQGVEEDEIVLALGKDIYCGINHVGQGIATICFLDHRRPHAPSMRERILQLAEDNSGFGALLTDGSRTALRAATIYGTGNISFGSRDVAHGGIYWVGDTAGVIAPLAGDGIAMALQGAQLLGNILFEESKTNGSVEDSLQRYRERWNSMFARRRRMALWYQRMALSSMMGRVLFPAISFFPQLFRTVIATTRGSFSSRDRLRLRRSATPSV